MYEINNIIKSTRAEKEYFIIYILYTMAFIYLTRYIIELNT
jgi:hypothetical protein